MEAKAVVGEEAYWNGRWTKEPITVPANDLSVLRGFGCFDFLTTYQRRPYRTKEHVARLFHSAELLGLTVPATQDQVVELVHEGIKRNAHLPELYIKMTVTGGVAKDGKALEPGESSFYVTFGPAAPTPASYYQKGLRLHTAAYERYIPKAKSLAYMAGVVNYRKAKEAGVDDVVYVDRHGRILEGPTWNFFAVRDGKILVPHNELVLTGITAQFVEEAAKRLGFEMVFEEVPASQIESLSEAFATSTTKGVMPITEIDGKKIGDGAVGPIVTALMKAFDEETLAPSS
jgi:branched-chain amino acid aminotransferase